MTGLKLLELQRYLMLMYTSCGWFFDELSGIETVQVIQYAGRALQLAGQLFSEDLSTPFLDLLAQGQQQSFQNKAMDGRSTSVTFSPRWWTWKKLARTTRSVPCSKNTEQNTRIYCYDVERNGLPHLAAGKTAGGAGTGQA